jgi:protein phosphatase 2C-like protein
VSELHACITPFRVPKAGNALTECDDEYWPQNHGEFRGEFLRLAVADGATESSYAGVWARLLVQDYCHARLDELTRTRSLTRARARWKSHVAKKKLLWYAEEKLQQGAFATLLGLEIRADQRPGHHGGDWSSIAVGDTCLVHVRNDDILACFPLNKPDQFAARPHLLSSKVEFGKELAPHVSREHGNWRSEDAFYLMTDALSAWFVFEVEQGRQPWQLFRDLETSEQTVSFDDLVANLRETHLMKNDDVTLIRVDLF